MPTRKSLYEPLWKSKGLCLECGSRPAMEGRRACEVCQVAKRRYQKAVFQRIRKELITHYGGRCACCGESEPLFLTLDHINNDGATQRQPFRAGGGRGLYTRAYYQSIIDAGFPADLRLLCYNCNCGRAKNLGVCPHEAKVNV